MESHPASGGRWRAFSAEADNYPPCLLEIGRPTTVGLTGVRRDDEETGGDACCTGIAA